MIFVVVLRPSEVRPIRIVTQRAVQVGLGADWALLFPFLSIREHNKVAMVGADD